MTSYFGSEFDLALRKLRKELPLNKRVVVRTVPPSHKYLVWYDGCKLDGAAYDHDSEFLIVISRRFSVADAVSILCHEYAHCWDIEKNGFPTIFHRDTWGVGHAKAYRIVYGRH